jgi:hypothetical protein
MMPWQMGPADAERYDRGYVVSGFSRTLERIWQDVRHGFRGFTQAPAFTAIAVISIAFGTGANVAIFSAVDALLLRPPPVSRPDELITVGSRIERGLGSALRMSYADFVAAPRVSIPRSHCARSSSVPEFVDQFSLLNS